MKLLGTMEIEQNELVVGGVKATALVQQFGSPLYVIDEADVLKRMRTFKENFTSEQFETRVIYASKAFTNLYMAGLVEREGLFMDVVSGGELYTALKGGVKASSIYFHGNNKLPSEIEEALDANIGTIVVDNEYEAMLLQETAASHNKTVRVLVRVNPGIDAHTHAYIQTATMDSKFGMNIFDEATMPFIKALTEQPNLEFAGIHCHIGSQVFEAESFFKEATEMLTYAKKMEVEVGVRVQEVNLGGGFGVYYTKEDTPFDLADFLKQYSQHIEQTLRELGLGVSVISIEPGRSLINNSGSTLYTIGAVKQPMAGHPYVFIDGGMTDNPRPITYQAKYDAALANRMDEKVAGPFRVAGKCCESGDLLIQEVVLPKPNPGDLLVVPSTGAYTYSMSSNYNRIARPAVVFVNEGDAHVVVKRETYQDLIRNDVSMKGEDHAI